MISLVVGTLNRKRELARLLGSLRQQTDKAFEIIVVDQNAPGYLAPVLEAFSDLRVRHARSGKGLSRARNVGLAAARGDIVAFPDDDCWYPQALVGNVLAAFEADRAIDVLVGRTTDADGRESVSQHLPASRRITRRQIFQAGNSSAIFVRASVARACGGFDETLGVGAGTIFGSGEETEFLLKAMQNGARIAYRRSLVVHHEQVARDPSRIRAYATGFGRVCRLHGLGRTTLAPQLARAAVRSALLAARGHGADARERWAWIAGSVHGYLARREKSSSQGKRP